MFVIRLSLIVLLMAGVVFGQARNSVDQETGYTEVSLAQICKNPKDFAGHNVRLRAEVVSVAANGKSLHLFDGESGSLINVSLAGLKKSERRALILSAVHRVSVSGRLNLDLGRVVLDAEKVEPLSSVLVAQR